MKRFRLHIADNFGEIRREIIISNVKDSNEALLKAHSEMRYDEFVLSIKEELV